MLRAGTVYAMFGGCVLTRDRMWKYAAAGALAAVTLLLAVGLNAGLHRYGDLSVMALDVGQGESVALYTREQAVLVDCGSSNGYISAGARAADQLESIGCLLYTSDADACGAAAAAGY